MSIYADQAEAFFDRQYNCAQAVFVPFALARGMEEETALRLATALGGGLGHSGEVCGAVLGMLLAVGLAKGYAQPTQEAKMALSAKVRKLLKSFRARYGETGCDALREIGNRAKCAGFVRFAAEQAEEAIGSAE